MTETEKIPIEEVKFLPVDPEKGKDNGKKTSDFVGLTKEELQEFADDPFWVRTRKILFVLFWVVWVGMVAAAVIIIVLSPKCPARPNQKWWETSAVYRVETKGFKDSDGDGLGDLKGLKDKLKYISSLGVGAVCLAPLPEEIFKAGGKTPVGSHSDLKALIKAAHKKGVKVVIEKEGPLDPNEEKVAAEAELLKTTQIDGIFVIDPQSMEAVVALRTAFDALGKDTGKDRALIVKPNGGNATQRSMYYGTAEAAGAHIVLNERLVGLAADPEKLEKAIEDTMTITRESNQPKHNDNRAWFNWALSTLAGGRLANNVDEKFVDAFNVLMLTLPGTPIIKYGDELGLKTPNGFVEGTKASLTMQWSDQKNGGFSDADEINTDLATSPDFETVNVKFQNAVGGGDSHLMTFKNVTELRSKNSLAYGEYQPITFGTGNLFTFLRHAKGHPAFFVAVNLGERAAIVPGPGFATSGIVGNGCEVVVTTPSAHKDISVGKTVYFKDSHFLVKPGDGVVCQMNVV